MNIITQHVLSDTAAVVSSCSTDYKILYYPAMSVLLLYSYKAVVDWMTRESEFKFNEEFSMIYGKGNMEGTMYNTCVRPQYNVIHCR